MLLNLQIIFDKDYKTPEKKGPFPIDDYVIDKSLDPTFATYEVVPGPYVDSGTSFLGLDASYVGPRPYYRVRIKSNKTVIATSEPRKVLDQKGERHLNILILLTLDVLLSFLTNFSKKIDDNFTLLFYPDFDHFLAGLNLFFSEYVLV